jgi:GTP-binding protein
VEPHRGDPKASFQLLVSSIDYNDYMGRIAIGKINRGTLSMKNQYTLIKRSGEMEPFKVSKILAYEGLKPAEISEACPGDIVSIAGMRDVDIGETIACRLSPEPLPVIEIDEPTLSVNFSVNDSPFAGRDGKFLTSRHLRERLFREAKSNVALRVEETGDTFKVSGRGELHLTILIETMRREGYEFSVAMPEVIVKRVGDKLMEPEEFVIIDVEDIYSGKVMELMGPRKGEIKNLLPSGNGQTRLEFVIPTRGLFGFRSEFLTATKGTGILNRMFHNFVPHRGEIARRHTGALISLEDGVATAYSLFNLQDRGVMFLNPGENVYTGMIIGENSKDNDLIVNICREKKLTNMRASGSDENIILTPPRKMSLEQVLEFINEDELAEITPKNIRLRKRVLDENERKRYAKARQAA